MRRKPDLHSGESRLTRIAEAEVAAIRARLPAALRAAADALPVTCMLYPSPELQADGVEPDLLGLFVGGTHDEARGGWESRPSQILLFLGNLWDYVDGDAAAFREEVGDTYLHELGHYLGLDEDDLARRDLL